MKRETLRHPKTYEMCAALDCSRPTALGYLTLLWDFTADQAIEGNIGKWKDGAIARACEWQGPPSEFVEALVDVGWLDRDAKHRLLVHDWADHCERWVKLKLAKLEKVIVEPTTEGSAESSTEASIEPTIEASPPRDQSKPNQSKPKRGANAPALFDRFWQHYRLKKGKGQAEKAWKKLYPDEALTDRMILAIEEQEHEREAQARQGLFVPEHKHPATWINGRCWEDEPAPASPRRNDAPAIGESIW